MLTNSSGRQSAEQQDVLDVQAKIRKDINGEETKEMIRLLQTASVIATEHMRKRLNQTEYRSAESLTLALESAEKVLKRVWESIHKRTLH